jgi:hypothetical protein
VKFILTFRRWKSRWIKKVLGPKPPLPRYRDVEQQDVIEIVGKHGTAGMAACLWYTCRPECYQGQPWAEIAKRLRHKGYSNADIDGTKELLPSVHDFVKILRERGYKFELLTDRIVNPSKARTVK